jgi:hypothetical protein
MSCGNCETSWKEFNFCTRCGENRPSAASDCYAPGDRVAINRLIAPEDLPVGSLGTIRKADDVCTDMVIIDWDAGWAGLYHPHHILKA